MTKGKHIQQLALVLIASGTGALVATSLASLPALLMAALGLLVWVLGEWVGTAADQRERARDFHISYSPAVPKFLHGMHLKASQRMLVVVRKAPVPYPDPVESWRSLDTDHPLKVGLMKFYGPGESELALETRKSMKMAYEEWSSVLDRWIRPRGFDDWLERVRKQHVDVFCLWLYAECALATAEHMNEPDFTEFRSLMDQWLEPLKEAGGLPDPRGQKVLPGPP